MRTRATRVPSGAVVASTEPPATTPLAASTADKAPRASASRKSTSNVNGSGRVVKYATGSDVVMVTVVIRRPASADSRITRGAAGAPSGARPAATSGISPVAQRPDKATTSTPRLRYGGRVLIS